MRFRSVAAEWLQLAPRPPGLEAAGLRSRLGEGPVLRGSWWPSCGSSAVRQVVDGSPLRLKKLAGAPSQQVLRSYPQPGAVHATVWLQGPLDFREAVTFLRRTLRLPNSDDLQYDPVLDILGPSHSLLDGSRCFRVTARNPYVQGFFDVNNHASSALPEHHPQTPAMRIGDLAVAGGSPRGAAGEAAKGLGKEHLRAAAEERYESSFVLHDVRLREGDSDHASIERTLHDRVDLLREYGFINYHAALPLAAAAAAGGLADYGRAAADKATRDVDIFSLLALGAQVSPALRAAFVSAGGGEDAAGEVLDLVAGNADRCEFAASHVPLSVVLAAVAKAAAAAPGGDAPLQLQVPEETRQIVREFGSSSFLASSLVVSQLQWNSRAFRRLQLPTDHCVPQDHVITPSGEILPPGSFKPEDYTAADVVIFDPVADSYRRLVVVPENVEVHFEPSPYLRLVSDPERIHHDVDAPGWHVAGDGVRRLKKWAFEKDAAPIAASGSAHGPAEPASLTRCVAVKMTLPASSHFMSAAHAMFEPVICPWSAAARNIIDLNRL
ncbi:hypothetical protein DIPPA_05617 [Diplonema papillatum]|nr:hypothetical protein DIPPA_05617 [Diplonema papillatum]